MNINIKDLEVLVASTEPQDTLLMLKKICPKARYKNISVGDIVYENIAIELKTWQDFIKGITDDKDNRYRNQLYNFLSNPDIIGYYFIYGKWTDINKYSRINMRAILGALASIQARYSVRLNVYPTKEYAIYVACKIIEKTIDHKEVKPITYKATTEDKAVNMLMESADRILEKGVRNALEHFGTVKKVVNSDPKELENIKFIGKETVNRFFETINHDFSKKNTEDSDLIDIEKNKVDDIQQDIDYDRMKIGIFTLIESYNNENNKLCPLINIEKLLPNLTGTLLRQMLNDLILESRIFESDNNMYEVF